MSENIAPAKSATPVATVPVSADAVDKVRGSLAGNSVSAASVAFYETALREAGKNPESLSFAEVVEVTRRLYAESADFRRGAAEIAKSEREAAAKIAKAASDEKKRLRLIAERESLSKRLAAIDAK